MEQKYIDAISDIVKTAKDGVYKRIIITAERHEKDESIQDLLDELNEIADLEETLTNY